MIESTLVYAIGYAAFFCLLILRRPIYYITKIVCPLILEARRLPVVSFASKHIPKLISEHLVFPTLLSQGKYIDRWSRRGVLLVLAYFVANISCVVVPWQDVRQAGSRAGVLAVINLLFLCAGPYLSSQADILGISLHACRRLHASAGLVTFLLAVFHAVVGGVIERKLALEEPRNLFAIIAISSLCAQALPLVLRRVTYEGALRVHQLLAFVLAYALWRHIPLTQQLQRLYLCIGAALFLMSCVFLLVSVLYRNGLSMSHARISYDLRTIKVRLHLHKPVKVDAGQYINVWVPSAGLWSFAQTHPFTVISWSDKPQDYLDLFIKPRRGFTKDLFGLSEYGPTTSIALFSGPHGKEFPIHGYENVVMMATGFGIAAHLPYLKKLIHDHQTQKTPIRRIHLIWQIEQLDVGIAAQQLLNEALGEDRLDGDEILRISMYSNTKGISKATFGERAIFHPGEIPLREIIKAELAERRRKSKTVVTLSADGTFRSALMDIMGEFRGSNIDLKLLEYQP